MKRRMKKFMSLLLAFSMIFSVFTVPVQASPADNTKTEQTAESETTAADDNQVNTAEEVQPEAEQPEEAQPEAEQPEEAQPEAAQPEEAQPEAAQPEEVQPETAQTNTSGQQTFSLRGGFTSFRLNPDGLDVSSVSAYNVVPEDGTEVDENDPAVAALAEDLSKAEVQAETENENGGTETEKIPLTEEQIQQVLYVYQQYLDQWKANANLLGVQLPFFLKYNDNKEDGLGILGEMLVLAGKSVEDVREGNYSFDDLMGMVQNFLYADKFGIEFYGETIASKRDEVLQKVEDSGAQTFVQKLLVINDWLAHQATFDMAYIMNMGKDEPIMVAADPQKHEHYDEIYEEMKKLYTDQITQQFHDQIYAGVVAQLRQDVYKGAIRDIVYNEALKNGATEDEANAAAENYLSENADAISEDPEGFVTKNFGDEAAAQIKAAVDDTVKTAETEGIEVDPENAPGYKMTVEDMTQNTMANEKIVDMDGDGEGDTTPNDAIPFYAKSAAEGLTNGILGAWEGNHIGILAEGTGVCAGYSKAFAYLVQYMCPEIYGVDGAETDMSVAANWKTAQDLYYDEDGKNLDITREYNVDMIRITFDARTSMFGEESNFGETHFWNAVKVDGTWYYVDPCYTDIYVECMSRDRVEIDGTMNHMYFMFSHKTALEMYEGNMKEIAGLYGDVSTDTSYEDSWFARMASNSYFDGEKVYYMYDSSDQLAMMREFQKLQNSGSDGNMDASDFEALMEGEDPTYSLVYHEIDDSDVMEGGADSDFRALIEFNHKEESTGEEGSSDSEEASDSEGSSESEGSPDSEESSDSEESVALVYNPETKVMEENELLTTLFAQYKEECDIYPSIKMTAALHNGKLYFNLSNCILSYELSTGKVEKVKEYNTVYGKRDKSVAFGGMGFSVCSAGEADLSVTNHPIAALTIKDDGKMYVSVATNYAFISGKSAVDDLNSYGYEFEESNYNPNYSTFMQGSDSEETNDNDEFMWSAVFVDTVDLNTSCSHNYASVTIAPTCGRDGYTENRCTTCGAPEEGSRKVDEGSALDAHHYVHFAEQYYTKDDNENWNTGECYVCTVCGFAIEEPDKPREDAEQEEIDNYNEQKAIWDNAVATAGHTYEPTGATWSNGNSKVTFSHLECTSVCPERQPYLDCLLDDENKNVSVDISAITVDAEITGHEGNCKEGVTVVYTAEGVTDEGYKYKATKKVQQEAGEHTYVIKFAWADNTAEGAEVPYTATVDVKCEVCGNVIADDVEADVTYDKENSKEATCTEDGQDVYIATASVTDDEGKEIPDVTDTKVVKLSAKGHTEVTDEAKEATCTENGLTEGKHCSVCDTVLVKQETVLATGHSFGEWVVTKDATETETGSRERECTVCGQKETEDIPKLDHTHTWNEGEVTKEATCTAKGEKTYTCSGCGATNVEEIDALGHDWNVPTSLTWNQVADEEGYATGEYTATLVVACNRCPKYYEKTEPAVKDDTSIAPTCTKEGTNVWVATVTVTDDDGNVIGKLSGSKEVDVPATGHTWDEGIVTTEATCTEDGVKTYTCTVCGETKTEAIAATGHNYENGTCTVCGEKENPFDDVNEDDYFYDAVLWAYEKGIAFGTNETHFSPWNNCTRAQVVTFLWRTMGEPTPETTENPFVDVAEDAHYYKAVLWAYENEITLGKDATHFEPDANVTRGQFVSFLHRNEGKPEPETTENPFVDVDENKYYYKAVLWAYENEITLGKDATHFVPENNCTRGQVVTFLYRAYGEEK